MPGTQHWLSYPTNETYACGASAIGRRSTQDRDPNITNCEACKVWPNGPAPRDPAYTDPALLIGVRIKATPRTGQTRTGYGPKVPTRYLINYEGRWRRVYVAQYGNVGSAYIIVDGKHLFTDTAVEARIEAYGAMRDEFMRSAKEIQP